MIKKTPRTTSTITINIAIGRTVGIKKSISKTVGPKYSSNLNEKPTGSFNLIKPEKINNEPTKYLKNVVNNFIIALNGLGQKLHS